MDAVVSCLGHNISIKGIFGKPHKLVTDAMKKVIKAIKSVEKDKSMKVILMNTTACINRHQGEKYNNKREKFIMTILNSILPPQRDNDLALDYLLEAVEKDDEQIEWVAVRPDTLFDESEVTDYDVYPPSIRSPIFDPGKTSRINVADFMVNLIMDKQLWNNWKYKTPVIYNR